MRVLVVGGAGYIGNEVCKQLDIKGIKHTVYDNFLYNQEPSKYQTITNISGDICNADGLAGVIEYHDAVIWLAAIVGEPTCQVIPERAMQINADALRVFEQIHNKRVIFTSTASVYGIAHGLINERGCLAPLGIYGESKVKAEGILRATDNNVAICRLGTAFGIRPYTRKRFDLAVNAMTRDAIRNGVVQVWGGGRKRPFIHISDIARSLIKLATSIDFNGTVNVSYRNVELIRLAEMIAIKTGAMLKCHEIDTGDMRNYEVSTDLARSLTLVDPPNMFPIESGIAEVADWVQMNRNYSGVTTNFEVLAGRTQ